MKIAISILALGVGLIFGCTPREQSSATQNSSAENTSVSSSVQNGSVYGSTSNAVDSVRKDSAPAQDKSTPHAKPNTANSENKMMRKSITNVLESNTHAWMEIPGVNGTGEGEDPNGQPAIIIFTDRSASEIQAKLPYEKDGYPIIVREIGVIKALEVEAD